MSLAPLYPPEAPPEKALFFASDLHAGAPSAAESAPRERHFVRWLEKHAPEAAAFYLLGDLWDFWFEYQHAVPKGHVRLLGALAAVADAGIPVFFQRGNHDLWLTPYLTEEIGLRLLADPYVARWEGKTFFLSHGHKIGPLPWIDRLTYRIMESPFWTRLYRWIHPDMGLWLGRRLSGRSRIAHAPMDDIDLGPKEYFRRFVLAESRKERALDWYIFGHRHLALVEKIGKSQVVLLGDWIRRFSYLRIDREGWSLRHFSPSLACLPMVEGTWQAMEPVALP